MRPSFAASSALRARESVFASRVEDRGGETCPASLLDCVNHLRDCCEELHETQVLVRKGTRDFPRMRKVIESQQVFLLVDEGTVKQYKSELAGEIEPAINELIERGNKAVSGLKKTESMLQNKVKVGQGGQGTSIGGGGGSGMERMEQRRLGQMRKQREKLEAELEALRAEVNKLESNRL